MRAHRSDCGWFWTWVAVGGGLVLSFIGIFSVGPFLLPFATLALGVVACRRPAPRAIAAGMVVAVGGIGAALTLSPAPDTVLAIAQLALVAFAIAAAGRLDAEMTGVVAGVAAFPLLRTPSGTPLRTPSGTPLRG